MAKVTLDDGVIELNNKHGMSVVYYYFLGLTQSKPLGFSEIFRQKDPISAHICGWHSKCTIHICFLTLCADTRDP